MNKIDGISPLKSTVAKESPRQSNAASAGPGEEAAAEASSNVVLTDAAQKLQQAEKQLKSAPEIDEARVSEIKDALDSGNYQIDPEKIASRLADLEDQL
ncbi:MAG: flagellar biosynthesis anti-sigma factor FlgM [Thiotrichales bacterium]